MICANCKTQLPDDVAFCGKCGTAQPKRNGAHEEKSTEELELTSVQMEQLSDALCSAFPNWEALDRMVAIGLDRNLDELVKKGPLVDIVFELIQWAKSQGKIRELVLAAYTRNPTNEEINEIATSLGLDPSTPTSPVGTKAQLAPVCPVCGRDDHLQRVTAIIREGHEAAEVIKERKRKANIARYALEVAENKRKNAFNRGDMAEIARLDRAIENMPAPVTDADEDLKAVKRMEIFALSVSLDDGVPDEPENPHPIRAFFRIDDPKDRRNYEEAKRAWEAQRDRIQASNRAAMERQQALLRTLYYCAQDDIVFVPGGSSVLVSDWRTLLSN